MRLVMLALVVCVAACSYGAPSYGGTAFRCDGEHVCPTGQTCIDGTCSGSGSGSMVGSGTAVVCMGQTCGSGSGCCYDPAGSNHCATAGTCTGAFAACTSAANCGSAGNCCGASAPVCSDSACGEGDYACTTGTDCPSDEASCCLDLGLPWGHCAPSC